MLKKKIAFIAPRYHTNQNSIVDYLIRSGNSVTFYVTGFGLSEEYKDLKPVLMRRSFYTNIIRYFFKANNTLFDYSYGIPRVSDIFQFRRKKYDVVIIRNPNNIFSLVFSIFLLASKTKIVFYTQREVYRQPHLLKDFVTQFYLVLFRAEWISPCLGDKTHPRLTKKLKYLPFCAHKNNYSKKWFKNDKVNILAIGKFVDRKQHHILIIALQKLASKYRFSLTIVGEVSNDSHKEYLSKIEFLASNCDFDVHIIQNISRKEVDLLYRKSDLFVMSSIREPASVSNLEAMSFGLPVIISDTNNTRCYIKDGFNGYIFKSTDKKSLEEKIECFLIDREKIKKAGCMSLELIDINHNPDKIYSKFFKS